MSPGCGYTTRGRGHDDEEIVDSDWHYISRYPDNESGRPMVGIDIVVIATIFTLIVLLTGGPSNWR
jgi:hypothetical protein